MLHVKGWTVDIGYKKQEREQRWEIAKDAGSKYIQKCIAEIVIVTRLSQGPREILKCLLPSSSN